MGVDQVEARATFERAVQLAASGKPLPKEWVQRTRRVGEAPNKTFVAMLGTALLARATNAAIDPLTLKSSADPSAGLEAYSARGLCQHVLVPAALAHSVHLGVTGREPLNNQPFYAKDRVHRDLPVRPAQKPHLDYLVECLERIHEMKRTQAERALAAFIRVRSETAEQPALQFDLPGAAVTLQEFADVAAGFIADDPEGGRRGQALVAAVFDVVFEEVETRRVNDPSRRGVGDVRARTGGTVVLAAEVRQKAVGKDDVLHYAAELSRRRVTQGMYVALHPDQPELPRQELVAAALQRGVALEIVTSTHELVASAASWSGGDLGFLLEALPGKVLTRMEELEVSEEGRRTWAQVFGREGGSA